VLMLKQSPSQLARQKEFPVGEVQGAVPPSPQLVVHRVAISEGFGLSALRATGEDESDVQSSARGVCVCVCVCVWAWLWRLDYTLQLRLSGWTVLEVESLPTLRQTHKLPSSRAYCLHHHPEMVAVSLPETLVNIYQTRWCNIPQYWYFPLHLERLPTFTVKL
jgi:hypothetical protein